MTWRAFGCAVMALLACCRCWNPFAPSPSIVGDWTGQLAPTHTESFDLRFVQEGSRITGTACLWDFSSKHLIYSNLPVTVDYPNVTMTLPAGSSCPSQVYSGKVDGATLTLTSKCNSGNYVILKRGGDQCAAAR